MKILSNVKGCYQFLITAFLSSMINKILKEEVEYEGYSTAGKDSWFDFSLGTCFFMFLSQPLHLYIRWRRKNMTAKIKKNYFFLKKFFEVYFFEIFYLAVHIGEQCIDNCNGRHGLYNDNCSWNDNGIMASPDADRDFFS